MFWNFVWNLIYSRTCCCSGDSNCWFSFFFYHLLSMSSDLNLNGNARSVWTSCFFKLMAQSSRCTAKNLWTQNPKKKEIEQIIFVEGIKPRNQRWLSSRMCFFPIKRIIKRKILLKIYFRTWIISCWNEFEEKDEKKKYTHIHLENEANNVNCFSYTTAQEFFFFSNTSIVDGYVI